MAMNKTCSLVPDSTAAHKPFKLLYITVSMPFGPGEEFFVAEVYELLRQGHEVLIVPRSPKGTILNKDAIGLGRHSLRRHLLGLSVLLVAVLEILRHPAAAMRALALLFNNSGLFVLAKNIVVFPKGLWLASVARNWQAEHIHAQWGLTTATMAMVASELTGIPWSFTAHRGDIANANLLATKTAKAAFARFISQSGLHIAEGLGALLHARDACVIHMGVALPSEPLMRTKTDGRFIVLCPANLSPVKGHKYLVEAMLILRNSGVCCALLLAGAGGLQKELQDQVTRLGLEATISFLGQVSHERLLQLYREACVNVVVLPSLDLGNHLHEGIPVCLMEAMAHGIPVVATETGGIPELLRDGAGLVVRPQDAEALADAIARLMRDPTLRIQLGIAGRRRIEDQFAVERTVSELAALIAAAASDSRALVA
jgi:glycosyltransferase involved in cell wall biosynthesis